MAAKRARKKRVAPHSSAGKIKCKTCGVWHTKSQHWSHAANHGPKSYRKKRGVKTSSAKSVGRKMSSAVRKRRAKHMADAPRFAGSEACKKAITRERLAAKKAFLAGVKAGKKDAARRCPT